MSYFNGESWIHEEGIVTKRHLFYEFDQKAVAQYDLEESIV